MNRLHDLIGWILYHLSDCFDDLYCRYTTWYEARALQEAGEQ